MSDMDNFLGKTVTDSINSANELNHQMDGLKLLGQRQINIAQQEQINNDKAYIRELERKIKELEKSLKNVSSSNDDSDGPNTGWAHITAHNGTFYRTQSNDGYKKEVARLQANILSLVFSLAFKKITLNEHNKHISILSKHLDVPAEIIKSTSRFGVCKYVYADSNKELLADIAKNEITQMQWFFEDKASMFDLLSFNEWTRAFYSRWLINVYFDEEHNILNYARNNPQKIETLKELLGENLSHINLENIYIPSLSELKLWVKLKTIIFASNQLMAEYQKKLMINSERIPYLLQQAKIDILNGNLTERESNIYGLSLSSEVKAKLASGIMEPFKLDKPINTKEELDKFHYNLELLKLEHRTIKKVVAQLAIEERTQNPIPEDNSWDKQYRDNDVGREALEGLIDLRKTLDSMNSNGLFKDEFIRHLNLITYTLTDQFSIDIYQADIKRETEKKNLISSERQKEYDDGIELLKFWKKYETQILTAISNLNFEKGYITFPEHLLEPIQTLINSKATIPFQSNEFSNGVIKTTDESLLLTGSEAAQVHLYIKILKSLLQYKVSLVAAEPINVGGLFNKKYVRDVYLRVEFDASNHKFIEANNLDDRHRKISIEPAFNLNGKQFNLRVDCGTDISMPHVIYIKIGSKSVEETIESLDLVITRTPGGLLNINYGYYHVPFNKTFIFNQKVDSLPIAPSHAKVCAKKIETWQDPNKQTLPKESYRFTIEELKSFSEGLRK